MTNRAPFPRYSYLQARRSSQMVDPANAVADVQAVIFTPKPSTACSRFSDSVTARCWGEQLPLKSQASLVATGCLPIGKVGITDANAAVVEGSVPVRAQLALPLEGISTAGAMPSVRVQPWTPTADAASLAGGPPCHQGCPAVGMPYLAISNVGCKSSCL